MKPAAANLRGKTVTFTLNGREIVGVVVTHIRNRRWMIQSRQLPKSYARGDARWAIRRIILPRDEFKVGA